MKIHSTEYMLGTNISAQGGIEKIFARAQRIDCTVLQTTTKNMRQWKAKRLSPETIQNFQKQWRASKIEIIEIHSSYLINLASPQRLLYQKSQKALLEELKRIFVLNIPYLVLHPGSHQGRGIEWGIERVAQAINQVFKSFKQARFKLLLETTAGQGSSLGFKFEHLAQIIQRIKKKNYIATCLDTAHIFSAGYEIRSRASYKETIKEFDKIIGLNNLKIIHLNDSKTELGSRVDKHSIIGQGKIGLPPLLFFVRDPRFKKIPKILETPGGEKVMQKSLAILKKYIP